MEKEEPGEEFENLLQSLDPAEVPENPHSYFPGGAKPKPSALQVSVGLVKVEGPKNIEGLVKMRIQVKRMMTMKAPGMTVTQAAVVLAREDHLRLLLQFG